ARGARPGPVHRGEGHSRRVLHTGCRRGRFAPGRHPHAREGPGAGRAARARQRGGDRHRRGERPRPRRPYGSWRHRGRDGGRGLRDLEPAHRPHGRRRHSAHARRASDDRRRAVPEFEGTVGEIGFPIVRDVDTNMYERQHGSEFEIGSYAHRPILWDPEDIPSIEESALSPTQLPFTQDDFDPQMEDALELFPQILQNEKVGVKLAINGLLSLTPDGFPILGETPEVKGLWSAAAIWIKESPGIAKTLAEWMTDGCPEIDAHASDVARFHQHQRTAAHVRAR